MTRRHKPVSTEPFQANITSLSHEGRGIASVDGKIKFLRGGLPDESVIAVNLHKHKSYDEGYVTQVNHASPDRVTPTCPHTDVCGGCSLQHLRPEAQILFKQSVLLEQLAHIANAQPEVILPPLQSPAWGYRHKARLGVKYVAAKQRVLVGFREINGRYLANIDSCAVLHPSVGQKLVLLSELIRGLEAYTTIPQIEVAIGDDATALIFRHLNPLSEADTAQLMDFAKNENIHIYLQAGGPQTVQRLWPTTGEALLSYVLPEQQLTLQFHPTNFTQINPMINRQMINRALALLDPQPHERILDLFCGLGNFTLPLAQRCAQVIGVEGEESLVARARQNAALNQLTNTTFFTANLANDFSEAEFAQTPFDKILIDPPRTGALDAIKILPKLKPRAILYVSCNPATLARDTKELIQSGYRLAQAGVMDMFPHTSHVESMALFIRA